jgi:replication factor A1
LIQAAGNYSGSGNSLVNGTIRAGGGAELSGSTYVNGSLYYGEGTAPDSTKVAGEVDTTDDLRTKAILDDGTGSLTVVLGRDLTAAVYGGDVEDAKDHARDAMDKSVVADAIREDLVGREYRAQGSLSVDDFGANLEAETFEPVDADPVDRAEALLAEVGE